MAALLHSKYFRETARDIAARQIAKMIRTAPNSSASWPWHSKMKAILHEPRRVPPSALH